MIEYLKNIIPRIKQYSKELDKSENFVDKNWVFIDDNNNQHEYIFLRNGRLIMTINSTTKEGSWELLPTGELLIKRSTDDYLKLANIFIEDALLILKISATNNIPFILINQKLIPDLNVLAYLEKFEKQKEYEVKWEENNKSDEDLKYRLLDNGEIKGPEFYKGKVIDVEEGVILNGIYKTAAVLYEKYVLVKNNVIERVFYKIKYFYKGQVFKLEQDELGDPMKGGILINENSIKIPVDCFIKVVDEDNEKFWIKLSLDNKIKSYYNIGLTITFILTALIFLVIFILFIKQISSQ